MGGNDHIAKPCATGRPVRLFHFLSSSRAIFATPNSNDPAIGAFVLAAPGLVGILINTDTCTASIVALSYAVRLPLGSSCCAEKLQNEGVVGVVGSACAPGITLRWESGGADADVRWCWVFLIYATLMGYI
jgi:hypothetical protein